VVKAFLRRDLQVALSYRLPFVLDGLSAAFTVVTFALVGEIVGPGQVPGSYLAFTLLGLAVAVFLSASVGLVGTGVRNEQMQGTLETLLATGVSPSAIAFGYAAYPMIWAVIVAGMTVAVGAAIGARAPEANWGLASLALVPGVLAFAGLGFAGVGLVLVFKRGIGILAWFIALLSLGAGELFPPRLLPDWVQAISQISPYTLCLEVTRSAVLSGASTSSSVGKLATLTAMAVVYLAVGLGALTAGLHRARKTGGLAGY
jgi:ABC-2 type transport system permease protein